MTKIVLVQVEEEEDDAWDDTAALADDIHNALSEMAPFATIQTHEVDVGEVLGRWPEIVHQYMVFDLDDKGFSLDFDAVFSLTEYVFDKPVVVCQTLLKLSAAIRNLHQQYYDSYNDAKEAFDKYEAERESYYWSDAYEMSARKTAKSIESLVKADGTWQIKKQKIREFERMKSRLWNARDLVDKTLTLCQEFVQKTQHLVMEELPKDRSFREVSTAVIETAVRMDENCD